MVIGTKDVAKLFAITIVICCAAFVCLLFLNYNLDIVELKDQVSEQGMPMYEAQVATGKVVSGIAGGCLVATSVVLLIFYVKNFIDSHGKELGILKALGYSNFGIAKHFWVFGLSVLIGAVVGIVAAFIYLPTFYEVQNNQGLLPEMSPNFHFWLVFCLLVLPTVFFMLLAVVYALIKLKTPVMYLLKEKPLGAVKGSKKQTKDLPFLKDLSKNTLKRKKILVFFVTFSAFCFSAMTQMAMSMKQLSSESFSGMILVIGLVLAFMTIFMSLTSVVKGNSKTIAMMKVFGYSERQCSTSILGCYRPFSYIGFVVGTGYQYGLLKIMMEFIYDDLENLPEYNFDFKALAISLAAFVVSYELILFFYSMQIAKQSVKSIMLE